MIGSALTRHLTENGHEFVRLVRYTPGAGEIWWDPDAGRIDAAALGGFDGMVHLASIPWPALWTVKAKQKMHANRLATNRLLARSLAGCMQKPSVLVCASGMGYYPSSGDTELIEDCPCGSSFLAALQKDGEAATAPASEAGIRVVHLRIPPVIGESASRRGGLQVGDGHQWMSWIDLDEMACIIEFILTTNTITGPVNAVSPNPLRNAEFARVSAQVSGKKVGGPLPAFIVHLMMGEMGDEFLLSSRRIQPVKLLAAGYKFHFPELEMALNHEMGKVVA
jgi:uncharacterized protein (TIGR01777 family)